MNISRDTATAFVLHPDKARGAMRESICCTCNGGDVYADPPCGQGFRILSIISGGEYICLCIIVPPLHQVIGVHYE